MKYWRLTAIAFLTAAVLLLAENLAVAVFFPHLTRFATDFSEAYLGRELHFVGAGPPQAIFLGDSVLWGYRLPAGETAVAILSAHGCNCQNFSFKTSSPPNYYAIARLMQAYRVHPKVVVLEINQQVFNPANDAYRKLYPAVASLAAPYLAREDSAMITGFPQTPAFVSQIDRAASALSSLYAMRSDIRETLYPPPDEGLAGRQSAALFEGTYDLTPLSESNAGVRFLEKTAELLHLEHTTVIAFMTPANHALLHEYINGPEYRANGAFLKRMLERRGVRVFDWDRSLPAAEFLDAAHLTAAGQQHLALMLAAALAPNGSKAATSLGTER